LKREILGQFERLEIPVPADKTEMRAFLGDAIKKLTGIELADDKLQVVVNALVAIDDKKAAYKAVFQGQAAAPPKAA
jgi:hypothetical protein